ncbi:MAG: HD domain-containing protein [Candidatus Methylomirabilis sp.]|nr:HD domain-containing protein [Deltaproteobacteria bacterium]
MSAPNRETAMRSATLPVIGLKLDQIRDADIYVEMSGKRVLYRGSDYPMDESAITDLLSHGHSVVHVVKSTPVEAAPEEAVAQVLQDANVPAAEKSKVLYTMSSAILEDAIKHPRADFAKRVSDMVRTSMDHLLHGSEVFNCFKEIAGKNPSLYSHSVSTAFFSMAMANFLKGFSQDDIAELGVGCMFHDVGKNRIPRSVADRPRRSPEAQALYEQHVLLGKDWVEQLGALSEIAKRIVLEHHERVDGKGFPNKLKGADIHPLAKIAAIADSYDSLTAESPYRPAKSPFEALKVMTMEMRGAFDPLMLKDFILVVSQS